jgi:nitrate reductase (NAD(P)H)
LDASGFITSNELHFVRNHGAVADCDFSTHTVQISGEVNTPCTITMKDLLSMPAMTLPVTMVCAGNRRKEVNKYKQTVGFNW